MAMLLTSFDLFDIFFRFLAVGLLMAIAIYLRTIDNKFRSRVAILVCVCLSGFFLLNTPIDDEHYGVLRGVLLIITEIMPFALWLLAYTLITEKQHFLIAKPIHIEKRWLYGALTLGLVWYIYFFGFLLGKGAFHQLNHLLGLVALIHIIIMALRDLPDDLVPARRNTRLVFALSISFYFCVVVIIELTGPEVKALAEYNLASSAVNLLLVISFVWLFFKGSFTDRQIASPSNTQPDIPLYLQPTHTKLLELMDAGYYKESQLTISVLAAKLSTPEHQLRELINKHLGYRNFSTFLNKYRIAAACQQFQDVSLSKKPILTIGLELGYGSIATFNRAFKSQTDQTPKEYRQNFQK